ncbi:MAG: hypothetical protein ABIQ99_03055 [Thermoflexales bacterium]
MNPFTQSLARELADPALDDFIADWDALEAMVVRVFRGGAAGPADEGEWAALRPALGAAYPAWAGALASHWPQTRAGGQPVTADPFVRMMSFTQAADIVGDWAAMQTLPAAREALNRMLVERLRSR